MSKHVPAEMEWFLADAILVFTFANGDNPLTWINTHLIKATSPEEAYTKALAQGELSNNTYTNTDQIEVISTFRGLKNLLLIYEKLEDGAEIMWTEYDDLTEEQISALITPKEKLGAFVLHSEESPVTRLSEAQDNDEGLASTETLNSAAQAKRDAGDHAGAAILYEQSLRTLRRLDRPSELAYTLRHAADVHSAIGELERAGREISEAISIYRDTAYAHPLDLANALRIAALNTERRSQAHWREARALYRRLNIQKGVDEASRHLSNGDSQ